MCRLGVSMASWRECPHSVAPTSPIASQHHSAVLQLRRRREARSALQPNSSASAYCAFARSAQTHLDVELSCLTPDRQVHGIADIPVVDLRQQLSDARDGRLVDFQDYVARDDAVAAPEGHAAQTRLLGA